jgi:hypothetical protein
MFRSKTLLVVGAGASSELGLPIGSTLKKELSDLLHFRTTDYGQRTGDGILGRALNDLARRERANVEEYFATTSKVAAALELATSIDNFLEARSDDPFIATCGKLAIVRAILDAERQSRLFREDKQRARDDTVFFPMGTQSSGLFPDCWLTPFFGMLVENASKKDLPNLFSNLSFVIFNYDRCVETYLHRAVCTYYDVTKAEASNILNEISFLHPYGVVGRLPWQNGDAAPMPFGAEPSSSSLIDLASGIRVFSERFENEAFMAKLTHEIDAATTIVYLGFSFQRQNMDLLRATKPDPRIEAYRSVRAFGTVMGVSASDRAVIEASIRKSLHFSPHVTPNLFNGTCRDLFLEFQRSIPS